MNEQEVTEIYKTLAPMAGEYANAQAEQIGQAQRSMGPLAANAQGATTSGLGNYTYNRLMRPQVDTMRDQILVRGYANQLNRLLSNSLRDAQRRYSSGGSGGSSSSSDSGSGINLPTSIEDTGTEGVNSGYSHTGKMDEETGLWKDDTENRMSDLSGEVGGSPIVDFFSWIGDTLSGKGAHRDALKQMWPSDKGYVFKDDGTTYWVYDGDKLVASGRL